jgi:hypothetical protein
VHKALGSIPSTAKKKEEEEEEGGKEGREEKGEEGREERRKERERKKREREGGRKGGRKGRKEDTEVFMPRLTGNEAFPGPTTTFYRCLLFILPKESGCCHSPLSEVGL